MARQKKASVTNMQDAKVEMERQAAERAEIRQATLQTLRGQVEICIVQAALRRDSSTKYKTAKDIIVSECKKDSTLQAELLALFTIESKEYEFLAKLFKGRTARKPEIEAFTKKVAAFSPEQLLEKRRVLLAEIAVLDTRLSEMHIEVVPQVAA